ncbi:MAG: D-glycero-beta-D-manno-heptose-7-phosphate kinase [Cytophagaceae bacterium]|nr:D-glycero-beta-D-manno-heptose-7-phosphate kinase [Cytophagaceae bacterium]
MPGKTKINSHSSLKEIFGAFSNLKVLIIGDVMIDSYLWGKVERISPEAPVPIVSVEKRDKRLGGAANVALNIQAMGATPILCSVIGTDLDGDNFITLLKQNKLSADGIIRSKSRITTIKHRVISGSHHMLRVDSEEDSNITRQEEDNIIKTAKKLIAGCDVVVFEDYDKGVLTKEVIEQIIDYCNDKDIPTVVDPKKRNFLHYKNASLFKPNRKEMKEGLKLDGDLKEQKEIQDAVAQLKKKLNNKAVLITLSERGIYIDNEKEKHFIPAHVREISDVSGAGDTVVSVAALCYALNLPSKFLAALSNLAGGIVCEHVGVVPINKDDLYKEAEKLKLF